MIKKVVNIMIIKQSKQKCDVKSSQKLKNKASRNQSINICKAKSLISYGNFIKTIYDSGGTWYAILTVCSMLWFHPFSKFQFFLNYIVHTHI